MTSTTETPLEDPLLNNMKASRRNRSVLKMDLVNLRAEAPNTLILVFEGVHDKGVYFSWLQRAHPELQYEPFPCDGKPLVLELKKVVDQDLNGLSRGVYFFVDRDFDELGDLPEDESIFMTDRYSIENYLVCERVLKELLKNEFHCHGCPRLRETIVERFSALYDAFLSATKEINFRLFCARKLGFECGAPLPSKIGQLARVDLGSVELLVRPEDVIHFEREPTDLELSKLRKEFDRLSGRRRYRGKFALLFFMEWLTHLARDRTSNHTLYFAGLKKNVKVRLHSVTGETLAGKSELPNGFSDFAMRMTC